MTARNEKAESLRRTARPRNGTATLTTQQKAGAARIATIGREMRAKRLTVDKAREEMRAVRLSMSDYDYNVAKLNSVKF